MALSQLMWPVDAELRARREQGEGPLARAFHAIACHSELSDSLVDYASIRREVEAGTFSLPPDPEPPYIRRKLREAVALCLL